MNDDPPINDAAPGATEAGPSNRDAQHDSPESEIAKHLRWLFAPGDVFEIRSPNCAERPGGTFTSTLSGYCTFERIGDLAIQVAKLDAENRTPAIYTTLNPVLPDLLARADHRLKPKAKSTTMDEGIACRRNLLIDIDPVRASDTSSTDGELALAQAKADEVHAFLRARGWPESLRIMSGNGHHLVHAIDLPADDGGLVERVLKALAAVCDTDKVKVDVGVHNAARITKIAGTTSRKGDDFAGLPGVEARPHRRARILSMPEHVVVSKAMLEAIAGEAPPTSPPRSSGGSVGSAPREGIEIPPPTGGYARFEHTPIGVRGYLESHGVTVKGERRDGTRTFLHLDRCPVIPECQATGHSDISVMVGDDGRICYKNQHLRGSGLTWLDVREAFEPGYKAFAAARKNGTWSNVSAPWLPPLALFVESEPVPFPIDEAFPDSLKELRDFIVGLAHEVQVPVDLVAMLVIAIGAACLAKKFEIEARPGWREICVLWVLVLLLSGERKSVIFRRLTDVILEWEKDEADRLAPEIASANEEREIVERQRAEARKQAGKGNAQARNEAINLAKRLAEMTIAVPPTLITTDTTSEALVGLMKSNGERALVASPEADALDVLLGRYDDRARPNMGVWLKGYSGDRIRVHRRGRPPEFLDNPALGVAMTVQPEAVRGMFANSAARGRGLLARFFPSVPRSMVGRRTIGTRPVPASLQRAYLAMVRRLLDIPLDLDDGPRVVRLGPDALALFTKFEIDVERALGDEGDLADRRDWGAKLCGGILRIAMTLHGLEVFGKGNSTRTGEAALEVSRETMIAALSWAPYLIEHERIANRIVGCDAVAIVAERVLKWLARFGKTEFSKREAFDAVRGRVVQSVDHMEYPLELLGELGYVRPLSGQPSVGRVGRPPSARYTVNPLWDRGDAGDGMDEKSEDDDDDKADGSEGTA